MMIEPNLRALQDYIEKNRPCLHGQLKGSTFPYSLAILNAATGLSIHPFDDVEETAPLFLKALQDQDGVT